MRTRDDSYSVLNRGGIVSWCDLTPTKKPPRQRSSQRPKLPLAPQAAARIRAAVRAIENELAVLREIAPTSPYVINLGKKLATLRQALR